MARYSREVPTELERVASKALRKNRDERYQTIKDFLLDLRSLKQELEFAAKLERSTSPEIRKISDATKAIATDPTDRAVRTATTHDIPRAIPHDITTPFKTRPRRMWLTLTALVVVVAT